MSVESIMHYESTRVLHKTVSQLTKDTPHAIIAYLLHYIQA